MSLLCPQKLSKAIPYYVCIQSWLSYGGMSSSILLSKHTMCSSNFSNLVCPLILTSSCGLCAPKLNAGIPCSALPLNFTLSLILFITCLSSRVILCSLGFFGPFECRCQFKHVFFSFRSCRAWEIASSTNAWPSDSPKIFRSCRDSLVLFQLRFEFERFTWATYTRCHLCACADEGSDQEWNPHDTDEFVLQHTQVSSLLRLKLAR